MMPEHPPLEVPPPAVPQRREPTQPEPPTMPPSPVIDRPFDDYDADLRTRLRRDRRVLLFGPLDATTATRTSAELMLLDGESADPVEVIVNSTGGAIDHVLGLIDVIGLMRAPVTTRCIGAATGSAAAVLASGTGGRIATGNARISVRVGDPDDVRGTVTDITHRAAELTTLYERLADHLAAVTNLSSEQVRDALHSGAPMDARAALGAGLIDEIAAR